MNDSLHIAFDDKEDDEQFLLVARHTDDRVFVINSFHGDAAVELYKILIGE